MDRCQHCKSLYEKQPWPKLSYCSDCIAIMEMTLVNVPCKFKHEYVPTNDVDLATLMSWEREDLEETIANRRLIISRLRMGLIDIRQGPNGEQTRVRQECAYVKGRHAFKGRFFSYDYWPGRESEAVIQESCARNLETGELSPWGSW